MSDVAPRGRRYRHCPSYNSVTLTLGPSQSQVSHGKQWPLAFEVTAHQKEKHNRADLGLFELSAAGLGSVQRD